MSTALAVVEKIPIVTQHPSLAALDGARLALVSVRTLSDVKKIRNFAEAAKVYARAANLGREVQNNAAEIALLAARKAGEILATLKRAKPKPQGGRVRDSEYNQTLKTTGTSERAAQRWQELSKVSAAAVAEYVQSTKINSDLDISASGLLKSVQRSAVKAKPIVIPSPKEKSVSVVIASLTVMRLELTELNAITKRVAGSTLDESSKIEVSTLIACLNQIAHDAADRATRLSEALKCQ